MTNPEWKLILTDKSTTAEQVDAVANPVFLNTWPTIETENIAVGTKQPTVKKVHAFLDSHDEPSGANKFDRAPVYAIIGCGFSATVDRATLSKKDIAGLDIVHIGFPDPWSGYVNHDMNQARELLTLPGYLKQPPQASKNSRTTPQERWLPSNEFASINAEERVRLIGNPKTELYQAGVVNIETIAEGENGAGLFKINLTDEHAPIIAEKVDILTGTGQQRILKPIAEDKRNGINMPEHLWLEYLTPVKMDAKKEAKPKVVSAEMYVRKTCLPVENGLVCITGSSPASIQAMEHALCEDGCTAPPAKGGVMVESNTVNNGFLPIGRLDNHGRDEFGNPFPLYRENPPQGPILPEREHVWFAEGYRIDTAQPLTIEHKTVFSNVLDKDIEDGMLLVTFRESGKAKRLVNNKREDGGTLVYGKFHQVVLGTGRLRAQDPGTRKLDRETGSAMDLAWTYKDKLQAINVGLNFPVGLEYSEDYESSSGTRKKRLRILGAAGINNPKFSEQLNAMGQSKIRAFESFLPAQARVNGEGVTLAGHTVAWANGFYELGSDTKRNNNINTATIGELESINSDLADAIYKARGFRIGPFISQRQTSHALEVFKYLDGKTAIDPAELAVAKNIKKLQDKTQALEDRYAELEQENATLQAESDTLRQIPNPTPAEGTKPKTNDATIKNNMIEMGRNQKKSGKIQDNIKELRKETGKMSVFHFMNADDWLFYSDDNWGKILDNRTKLASLFNITYVESDWTTLDSKTFSAFSFRPHEYIEQDASKLVGGIDRLGVEGFTDNYFND